MSDLLSELAGQRDKARAERDLFQIENQELREENDKLFKTLDELRTQADALKKCADLMNSWFDLKAYDVRLRAKRDLLERTINDNETQAIIIENEIKKIRIQHT